jgi:plastocyanin
MYSLGMSVLRLFALAVCVALALLGVARPAAAASIRGVVTMTGAVVQKKLPVTIDQYVCGKEKPGEELVVNPQGGVKNAVVWLQTPPPGATWPSAPEKVEMDQKACVFVPRVVIVPAGGTVEFLNSDRLLHNLHSASKDNPTFNRTQPRGRVIPVTFSKPEIIQVNCDLHSWMRSWVVVADHPFYALSNDAGEFVLPNVPPGKYVLQIWQESVGVTSRDVTVGADDARVTVELKAPR